jgi:hypothetical protein
MPCRDYYDDHPQDYYGPQLKSKDAEIAKLKKQVSFAESALCQTLAAFEKALLNVRKDYDDKVFVNPMDYIDYKEAGIARQQLEEWLVRHKELDAKHRASEAEKKRKASEERRKKMETERRKQEALSKLSSEDKKILGIK